MSYASERKILTPVLRKLANRDVTSLTHRDFSASEQVLARWGRKPKKLDPKLHKKLIEQKKAKASSRASHNQETAKIREDVFVRADDYCELDLEPFHWATELHHLEGGSGRTALQAVSNCVAACSVHHRLFHRQPEAFRARILAWAAHYGYPVPRRYRGPPKLIAAGPSKTAPSSEVSETNPEPAKAGGAP